MDANTAELRDALVLVAVSDAPSLSSAAAALGMSVATVSRRVTAIEQRLRARLVERTTRSLRMTPLGRELSERFGRGLADIGAAYDFARDQQADLTGTVRVSAPPSVGPHIVPPLVAFRRMHPLVHFQLQLTERRLSPLDDDVDVLLRVGELADDRLVAREIVRYRHVLLASPSYLAEAPAVRRPTDLTRHVCVGFGRPGGRPEWRLLRRGKTRVVELRRALQSNDYDSVRAALLGGAGVGELPEILVGDAVRTGELVRVLPGWTMAEVPLTLLFASDRLLPRVTRAFVEYALAEFPAHFAALRTASRGRRAARPA